MLRGLWHSQLMTTFNVLEAIHTSPDHAASYLDNLRTFKLLIPVTFTLKFCTQPSFYPALAPLYMLPSARLVDILHLTFKSLIYNFIGSHPET